MTPIDQVRPTLPGNLTRRPDARIRRAEQEQQKKPHGKTPRAGQNDPRSDTPAAHIDELA